MTAVRLSGVMKLTSRARGTKFYRAVLNINAIDRMSRKEFKTHGAAREHGARLVKRYVRWIACAKGIASIVKIGEAAA